MADVKVSIDGNSVVASGSVMVAPSSNCVTVKIGNLTFNFSFVNEGGDSSVYLKGGGKELNIIFRNYKAGDSPGRTKTLMKVATYDNANLFLGYRARFNKNGSRDLTYTFVQMPRESADVEVEANDD